MRSRPKVVALLERKPITKQKQLALFLEDTQTWVIKDSREGGLRGYGELKVFEEGGRQVLAIFPYWQFDQCRIDELLAWLDYRLIVEKKDYETIQAHFGGPQPLSLEQNAEYERMETVKERKP